MIYRLGLDIGTNSIGWCTLNLNDNKDPVGIRDCGVRVFPDGRNPKDNQSLAAMRRGPRQQRVRRDRYLKRRSEFLGRLIEHGLMPTDALERKSLETKDPWELRVRGLDEKLTLHELGRALFHLQQRRGFKSNRKTDKGMDNEKGKIKQASAKVREDMVAAGSRTLGEHLARPRVEDRRAAHVHFVRARLKGAGAQTFYEFYPTRDLIAEEFITLWTTQKGFHGAALTDSAHDELLDTLLFQRDLKPQPVGKCALNPIEHRAPRALPSVQRLRIYQEINHLEVRLRGEPARKLTLEERNKLVTKALGTRKQTFDNCREALKLSRDARFNLESWNRKDIDGDKTSVVLASSKLWGPAWRKLPFEDQEAVVERLLETESEKDLADWLQSTYGLSPEVAERVGNTPLPEGHSSLGRTATSAVLEQLERDVIPYSKAVETAGLGSHSALDFDGKVFNMLPYYGEVLARHVAFGSGEPADPLEKRVGKIANPTVHMTLNQIRHVVNAVIQRHGPPAEIVVELARDLSLSAKAKAQLKREQNENKAANDERRLELQRLNQPDCYENRLRLRLWEELNKDDPFDRRCVYTAEQISIERLFSDSVEIEHILPFSRTLDDGIGNKTLCMRRGNRDKGRRSPHEAFHDSPLGYNWEEITARAANLPPNKSWRFGPDAMSRFENEERDFLARHLNETRYVGRLAALYLQRTGAKVWVTPGRLTANLRWAWGLDQVLPGHNRQENLDPEKNRNDHRHHAIDAIVVALTDRRLLQAVATGAARAEERFDKRLLAGIGDPWPHFFSTVQHAVSRIVVSHKPDHGVQGALHNDTAYGIVKEADARGRSTVVHRVPLDGFKKPEQLTEETIRDPVLRLKLLSATEGLSGKEFTSVLVRTGELMKPPVRGVRVHETLSVIPISDGSGEPYKAYKGDSNYCYDIFVNAKGKWTGKVVSRFEANQKTFSPKSKALADGTPIIMRIRQNDLIAIEEENRSIMRIVKFSECKIVLAEHFEAGNLKRRDADKTTDPFNYLTVAPSRLQEFRARLVHADPAGRLFDPGPLQ